MSRRPTSAALLLLTALAAGCAGGGGEAGEASFVESGDMAQIHARGQLRVLLPARRATGHLPRTGHSLDFEEELLEEFAREQGLVPVWIRLDGRERLISWLLGGRGDLIAANLTASEERRRLVDFTLPVAVVREQLVTRVDDDSIAGPADLAGRRVAIRASSSFWQTVQELRREVPDVRVEEVPDNVDTEEIIHRVAVGEYDVTVADSNLVDACLEYRDDIRVAFDLTDDRPIALAVRPGSSELLEALNEFLAGVKLARRDDEPHFGDLEEITQRRVLRMLTRNTAATYFLWRGRLKGFDYELVKEFARRRGLRLEVIVPPSGEQLLPWLRQGRGDVVAASLTPTAERRRDGVVFTRPYNIVSHVVVARADEDELDAVDELRGRTFVVRRASAYWEALEALREAGIELRLEQAPPEMETEEIIARVAAGEFDLTLADSHIVGIELTWRDDIQAAFPLAGEIPLAWAVRESNPSLRAALDDFIRTEYRGLFYNVVYDRYFEDSRRIRRHVSARIDGDGRLSPFDEIVKRYAEQYGFDWRLIVAQMYQESGFDPRARSFAGARGLMQVLPRTAAELGLAELEQPEVGIHAGVRYLDWVRDRFEPDLPVKDRMWFTLAGYNAGPGHVQDARRLAAELGLNPNRWFGNVEEAMLLLQRPKYAQAARHGYCRCSEPVRYVREIQTRYNAYVDTLGS